MGGWQNSQYKNSPSAVLGNAGYGTGQGAFTPTVNPVNTAGMAPATAAQNGLISALQNRAAGRGPTEAGTQLEAGTQQALKTSLASQAANRGQPAGQAAKTVAQTGALVGQEAAGQAATTKAGEIEAAQGQLGTVANQASQTQLQAAMAQQQAQQEAENLAAAQAAQYNAALAGLTSTNQQATNTLANQYMNPSTYLNMIGGGAQGMGSLTSLSDEETKQMISSDASSQKEFLDALSKFSSRDAIAGLPAEALTQTQPMTGGGQKTTPPQPQGQVSQLQPSQAAVVGQAVTTPAAATDAGMVAGGMLSDERSKDHIDKLTNILAQVTTPQTAAKVAPVADQLIGGNPWNPQPVQDAAAKASDWMARGSPMIPVGSRLWNLQQGNGLVQGTPTQQYPRAAYAFPATPPPAEAEVIDPTMQSQMLAQGQPVSSSEEDKTGIEPANQEFLNDLKAHSYQYKDPNAPGAAPGTHFGPMAQELEQNPIGKSTVIQGPDGHKMVDTGRLTLALASAGGVLNDRVSALEAALGKKTSKRRK